jgi:cell division septum initiation protein DivIVA
LDSEIIFAQFEEIEKRVEKVIEVCKTLEATNLKLEQRVKELEGELQGKAEAETRYTRERELIRSKVDALLSRLDEIAAG